MGHPHQLSSGVIFCSTSYTCATYPHWLQGSVVAWLRGVCHTGSWGSFFKQNPPKQCEKVNKITNFRHRERRELTSSGKLVTEPLQSSLDYGSLSVSA